MNEERMIKARELLDQLGPLGCALTALMCTYVLRGDQSRCEDISGLMTDYIGPPVEGLGHDPDIGAMMIRQGVPEDERAIWASIFYLLCEYGDTARLAKAEALARARVAV